MDLEQGRTKGDLAWRGVQQRVPAECLSFLERAKREGRGKDGQA